MELRHIRYFLAVANEGSFTRAAALLGIAQPPLSAQIKQLETEVGVSLFKRLAQGVELTAAGSAFADIARGIPALADHAARAALRTSRGEMGKVILGFTASSIYSMEVAGAIGAFRQACPDVTLELEEANTARLLKGLHEGWIDAAFLRLSEDDGEALDLRPLRSEPMIAAVPEGHPAAASEAVSLMQFANDPLLLFPREIGPVLFDAVVGACRQSGFEPNCGQTTPQIASMINLVAARLGIAIVPASMGSLKAAGVVFKSIVSPAPFAPLAFACRRGDTSPVVRNFKLVVDTYLDPSSR